MRERERERGTERERGRDRETVKVDSQKLGYFHLLFKNTDKNILILISKYVYFYKTS